jgi:hypothetical protein
MEKIINDHINMLSAGGGKPKAVPCWQIRQWIDAGKFDLAKATGNEIGYNFVDHDGGKKYYAAWIAEETRKIALAKAKARIGAVPAPSGIAGAATELDRREAQQIWGEPPMPAPGTETVAPAERPKPKDVI